MTNEMLRSAARTRLAIGSSDRGGIISGEPRGESMLGINQLRLIEQYSPVAQSHR
jgi:hypothetical protein